VTVGELNERLLVVRLGSFGDPDRPAGELSPEAEVPDDRLAAAVVPGDRAGPWHVPDDLLGEQLLDRREIAAGIHLALAGQEPTDDVLGAQ